MENWLYIKEDIGFRLGGKAKKGYTQEELKTFDELDQEDYLFRWEFRDDKLAAKEQWQLEGITYVAGVAFKFYGFNVLRTNKVYGRREISAKAIGKTVYALQNDDSSIIYVYSTYDMSENEAYMAAQDFFEEDVDESVDFRLGGKKQSGYDQGVHKTFNELKPGDPMWWVKIRRDGKHDMHIEKEWQREFSRIDYTMRDPDALILDSTGRCRLRCFVDELDKTMAASCESPYNSEALYLMTTYKPDIDDIKKKVNSFDGFRMDESTEFRLGGSKDKGEKSKTFADLKPGDEVYVSRLSASDTPLASYEKFVHKFEKLINKSDGSVKLYCRLGNGGRGVISCPQLDCSAFIVHSKAQPNYYFIYTVYDIDKEETIEFLKKSDIVDNLQDEVAIEVIESVDFRLGGKANKGERYGNAFNELRVGDTIYEYRFEDILKPNYTLEEHVWEIYEIEKIDKFHTCFLCERVENGEFRHFTLYVQNEDMNEPIIMYEQKDMYSRVLHKYHIAITTYEADVERIHQTLIETFLKH